MGRDTDLARRPAHTGSVEVEHEPTTRGHVPIIADDLDNCSDGSPGGPTEDADDPRRFGHVMRLYAQLDWTNEGIRNDDQPPEVRYPRQLAQRGDRSRS